MEEQPKETPGTRTIYNAGPLEIFWKNFLAGISQALGGLFIYLIILIISGIIFSNVILPKILPLLNSYTTLLNSLGQLQNIKLPSNSPSGNIPSIDLFK